MRNTLFLTSGACKLHMLTGYNSGPDQFVQIHDTTGTSVPPNDGHVPLFSFPVASGQFFSFDFGVVGVDLMNACVVNSSTAATKTLGSADCSFQGIIAA